MSNDCGCIYFAGSHANADSRSYGNDATEGGSGIRYCPMHKAAPELLEACWAALLEFDDEPSPAPCWLDKMGAAVRNAERAHEA
jgi:hypothetical protein